MNKILTGALNALLHPNVPTQYEIELAKAAGAIYIADALERLAIVAEEDAKYQEKVRYNNSPLGRLGLT